MLAVRNLIFASHKTNSQVTVWCNTMLCCMLYLFSKWLTVCSTEHPPPPPSLSVPQRSHRYTSR